MSKNAKADAFLVTTEDDSYDIVEVDVLESYAIKTETVNMWNRLMMMDRNSMYLNYTLRNILNILE